MKRSEIMHKLFGCKFPEGNISCAIESILNKEDTFIVAPIRARFAPIYATLFNKNGTTLIIEPTISAARIQVAMLKDCGVSAECLDGKQKKKESARVFTKLLKGQLNFLYVTPQRLSDKTFLGCVKSINLFMIVVDECQCVIEWGKTFCKKYLNVGNFINSLKHRPVAVAVSAYMEEKQRYEIAKLLHMKGEKFYYDNLDRPNVEEVLQDVGLGRIMLQDKFFILKSYVENTDGAIIIFCEDSNGVEKVYNKLHKDYESKITYTHSKLNAKQSTANELDFVRGKCKVIVATPAFGFGMDKADIRLVVIYGAMMSYSEYLRCSRYAGLDNKEATSLMIYYQGDYWDIFSKLYVKKKSHLTKVKKAELYKLLKYLAEKSDIYIEGITDL